MSSILAATRRAWWPTKGVCLKPVTDSRTITYTCLHLRSRPPEVGKQRRPNVQPSQAVSNNRWLHTLSSMVTRLVTLFFGHCEFGGKWYSVCYQGCTHGMEWRISEAEDRPSYQEWRSATAYPKAPCDFGEFSGIINTASVDACFFLAFTISVTSFALSNETGILQPHDGQ